MEIREKLVELLLDAEEKAGAKRGFFAWCQDNKLAEFVAEHLLANGMTVQEWIPVTERLPTPNTWVMVYRRSVGNMGGYTSLEYLAFLHGGTTAWSNDFETWKSVVTHWMPLPTPPKGEIK